MSLEAETSCSPSEENLINLTMSVCPFSICKHALVCVSHSRTVLRNAEVSCWPLGKNIIFTQLVCPFSVCKLAPDVASYNRTVLLTNMKASCRLSGENITDIAGLVCLSSICKLVPVFTSHSQTI